MKAIMYIVLVAMMSSCIFNNNNTDKVVVELKEDQATPPQPEPPKIPDDSIVKLSDNYSLPAKYIKFSNRKGWTDENLYHVTLPDTTTVIFNGQFFNNKSIESITIPSSVTKIGDEAFWDCEHLKHITIPSSLVEIGDGAFAHCFNIDTLILPNTLKTIGPHAFMGTNLEYINIPPSVETIGYCAFGWLWGYFTDPDNIDLSENFVIEDFMMFDKDKTTLLMTMVAINEEYDPHTRIPDGVKTIKYGVFEGHRDSYSVTLPSSVTNIEDGAFNEESLEALYMSKDSPILAKMRRKFGNRVIVK